MTVLAPALIGALAGLHAATWGMYKDALYEGFSLRKYLRSVLTGSVAALAIQAALGFDLSQAAGFILLFGTSYALERFVLESWKSFVRTEAQDKYFIPMAFAVNGRVVASRRRRLVAGAGYVGAVALVVAALATVQQPGDHPPLAALLLAGTVGGWLSAFGGAWKDAPKEGFQLLKFFRSPLIALAYALLLTRMTDSYLVVAFASLGLTVASIETHKKFGRPLEAPGKFTGKPLTHPEMFARRRRFVPVYVGIWAIVGVMLLASLVETTPLISRAVAEQFRAVQ
jgi:hypothetical protein